MTDWQPLSVRRGARDPFELTEGIPPHLTRPLLQWIEAHFTTQYRGYEEGLIDHVAVSLHITSTGSEPYHALKAILQAARGNEDVFLEILDLLLHLESVRSEDLRYLLATGHSVWTVDEEGEALVAE